VNTQTILIGGIVPAVLFGVGTVLTRACIGTGAPLICGGATVISFAK
jgi:hypothetical protein